METVINMVKWAARRGFNGKLAFAIAAAALGSSFQHGYNTGVLNNPKSVLVDWINATAINRTGENPDKDSITLIYSLMTSVFCIGGMIGGATTGFIADRFGRKGGLLLNNILVLLATISMTTSKAASSYELIIFGRFLIGINSGLNAGLAPMYLAEVSPINLRGAVGTVYQLVITISILISQILGLSSILGTDKLWPTLLAMTIVPAIFQVITLPFCPESPKYLLLSKGNEPQARSALSWLRGSFDVHEEMDVMKAEYEAMKLLPKVTLRELLTNTTLRIPLMIALTVMIAQQLSGINAVMFFSSEIFEMAGLHGDNPKYATLAMGGWKKTLLLLDLLVWQLILLFLTIGMSFARQSSVAGIFCIIFVSRLRYHVCHGSWINSMVPCSRNYSANLHDHYCKLISCLH
ncbi:hypothetical protein JTB14_025655 [Gonioctena quinquepunctata]|nr:hypothetical protein JTB14_025655 [Gonioctena quinquepunctata]